MELGAGTGFVGIGLALSLNARSDPKTPRVRILSTDGDKNTVKNMRFNLNAGHMTKSIRAEPLEWGGDEAINQPKFLEAARVLLKVSDDSDPIHALTHVIGSDVHFGEATLEPLSSVVASLKLRHPAVKVILMTKDRTPGSMFKLKRRIEEKVANRMNSHPNAELLNGFTVRMRDVLHEHITTVKILDC